MKKKFDKTLEKAADMTESDFYEFDFYKDKCDESKDTFGFMCSEYVFAGEYSCYELIHERGYKDCHCACQDSYTEAPRQPSGKCPATCAIPGHTCNNWLDVYARRNAEKTPLLMDAKGGGKLSSSQPPLTCARMEHSWGCDCSGCNSCIVADDKSFKTGDSSERGSRVPMPRLSSGLEKSGTVDSVNIESGAVTCTPIALTAGAAIIALIVF
jgi:hypothetical protein